eukprot:Gb_31918 [translate_table: standard]
MGTILCRDQFLRWKRTKSMRPTIERAPNPNFSFPVQNSIIWVVKDGNSFPSLYINRFRVEYMLL